MRDKELWRELCEQAAIEQDPDQLHELIAEITRLLDEKEKRLKSPFVTGSASKSRPDS